METFTHVRQWIQPNYFLVNLDLKDQFLSVPISKKFHNYLCFNWLGKIFQWVVLPFGLKCSPRVVTKLLKPVMALLRSIFGILISVYMDDMLIQAKSAEEAYFHAQLTILVLLCLGWEINWSKSNLIPTTKIKHLGFVIDTEAMTAICPADKIERLRNFALSTLRDGHITVHNAEKILGLIESVRPTTKLAALHYRGLQKQLLQAKIKIRVPNQIIQLSQRSKSDLKWWASDTGFKSNSVAPLMEPTPTLEIWSDASHLGAGAHSSRGENFQREWSNSEKELYHINFLELRAAKEAVFKFARRGDIIRLHLDNMTACAYIRKQGGTRSNILTTEACELWQGIQSREVYLLAPHWLPSLANAGADYLSRHRVETWELELSQETFHRIMNHFSVAPTLDAFASPQAHKLPRYFTWEPDPLALGRDALLYKWDPLNYIFPPVPLIPKILSKLREEKIDAILICPLWPTAMWWLLVQNLLVKPPFPLPHYKEIVTQVSGGEITVNLEPLVACYISGKL